MTGDGGRERVTVTSDRDSDSDSDNDNSGHEIIPMMPTIHARKLRRRRLCRQSSNHQSSIDPASHSLSDACGGGSSRIARISKINEDDDGGNTNKYFYRTMDSSRQSSMMRSDEMRRDDTSQQILRRSRRKGRKEMIVSITTSASVLLHLLLSLYASYTCKGFTILQQCSFSFVCRRLNTGVILMAKSPHSSSDSLFADSPSSPRKKNKKKNKYAKFSKVEKIEKDPFDALVEESEHKLKSIQEQKELDPLRRQEQAIVEQGGKILTEEEEKMMRLQFPNTTEINPYDATSFGYVPIGTIVGPHGVHGWTKVQAETDFPERLTQAGMILHLKPPRRRAPRKVILATGKQVETNVFLIQLQGVYNRTTATKLKGAELYYATQQDTLVKKEEGEMLISDYVGLKVYKHQKQSPDNSTDQYENDKINKHELVGEVLGVVLGEEMCSIPGLVHDQLEIQIKIDDDIQNDSSDQERNSNKRNGDKRRRMRRRPPPKLVLIPMVPEIITKVDLEEQSVFIDPPAGLLDLTYEREEKVKIKGLLAPASDD